MKQAATSAASDLPVKNQIFPVDLNSLSKDTCKEIITVNTNEAQKQQHTLSHGTGNLQIIQQ